MITLLLKTGDGTLITDPTEHNIQLGLRDKNARFWLDMEQPSPEELAWLDELFGFHPLAIEDTIQYQQRPKIEHYHHLADAEAQGYCYIVIHGPDLQTFREKLRTKELDIFVCEKYLVTIHEEAHRSINEVRSRAVADPRRFLDQGIDVLLYNILDLLVDAYMPILDYLQEEIDELEEAAAANPQPELLPRITAKKRDLLTLRRIIAPQRDVLSQMTRGEVPFIREHVRIYYRDVQDHLVRAVELIELYRDLAIGARDIYLSGVSNNLNVVMKALTVITVIAAVLNVITGFFGMNFDSIPGLHSPIAFYVIVCVMIASIVTMIVLFKQRRWL
jgi:magnesium transporter